MLEILTPAKINLFLLVGERRPDGYHPICSLMEKVSLYDRLRLESGGPPGVKLVSEGLSEALPPGENIVEKAARLLLAETGEDSSGSGAAFDLAKQIPAAAGLAGGSSDAAAALKLLMKSFAFEVDEARLAAIARQLGADVPFFLKPGPCLAEGAGEELMPVDLPSSYHAVIAVPAVGLSTAEVYRLFDEMCPDRARTFNERSKHARAGITSIPDIKALSELLVNDLEIPAVSLCPEIEFIKGDLLAAGAEGALMSGSGPSVFGLFAGKNSAEAAASAQVAAGRRAWVVAPVR